MGNTIKHRAKLGPCSGLLVWTECLLRCHPGTSLDQRPSDSEWTKNHGKKKNKWKPTQFHGHTNLPYENPSDIHETPKCNGTGIVDNPSVIS